MTPYLTDGETKIKKIFCDLPKVIPLICDREVLEPRTLYSLEGESPGCSLQYQVLCSLEDESMPFTSLQPPKCPA